MAILTELEHRQRKLKASDELARIIRSARLARGMSQEQVALDAGIALYTYSCLERGIATSGDAANPTLDTVLRVFGALDLDLGPQAPRSSGGAVGDSGDSGGWYPEKGTRTSSFS